MAESPHYKELLHTLNELEVEYLIVGGYAVMKYTEPRYTKDLDVWVHNSPRNSIRLYHALAGFGAPLAHDGVTPETFTKDHIVYHIGVLTFDTAWQNRVQDSIFGVPVHFISLSDLITNKQATGRSTDLEHVKDLEREGKKKA